VTHSVQSHSTESIRNIAILGHAGAGKTTLIEALLAKAGEIRTPGSVEKGSTVCDFTEQEKRLRHSLDVHVCHLRHDGRAVNLLDTPGYPDFMGRTLAVLPAVETAAVVINAECGAELVAQLMMASAAERQLCRLVIVNKIDASGVDLQQVLQEIRRVFGKQCLPVNLPARHGQAVADCFFAPADESPDFSSIATAHDEITDRVVELDDELMDRYLEQGEALTLEQLHEPFERALRRGHLVPVCFVSAKTGAGLRQLLRVMTQLMPNPLEGNPPEFVAGSDRHAFTIDGRNGAGHFVGHVFKLNVDPYVGRLAALRVHQGEIHTGDQVFVGARRKAVKLAHLYTMQGKELREVPAAVAGDFCAVAKIDDLHFGDVLHSSHDEDELALRGFDLPAPMHGVAIELKQHGQEKKLSEALHKLAVEDPSLKIELDAQTNDTVLRGLGELHVRLVIERMQNEFGLDLVTRPPKVAYRETVSRGAEGHNRHKKQTGGAGQFGEVFLRVAPLPRGAGFQFASEVVGGAIPTQYIPAVEKGVRQLLAEGATAGYPLVDVRVVVYDGKHHSVDSKEIAFIIAGKKAFKDAIAKAGPLILEPIAKLAVLAPSSRVGDITGHLAAIRGRILGTDAAPNQRTRIHAQVPLAELDEYAATLKSLTGGEGTYTLEFDHYAPAPPATQKALVEAYRPHADD
jgi:elongation factor G